MGENEKIIWGIHGGRQGIADDLFLKRKYIALGWSEMGDLGTLEPNRDAFKAKVSKVYPTIPPGAIPNNAGQLYRFVYEVKVGDLVIYPSTRDRRIHIGHIEGKYKFDLKIDSSFPNLHSVKWLRDLPRTDFSQGALYEIGSAMSFFQVKNYAEEFLTALEGKTIATPPEHDPTIETVSRDVEQNTRDFILKQLAQEFKGHPLAEFIAHLLGTMGYRTRLSPEGPDGGVDIIAHKDELGFEPPVVKVQVKSTEDKVSDPIVSALYGKVATDEYGLLITLGAFTNQAKSFAKSKSNLRLIDGDELVDLILQHYEQFDSRYKGQIPLKRAYVPQSLEESEG